jgi:hypothetical protein
MRSYIKLFVALQHDITYEKQLEVVCVREFITTLNPFHVQLRKDILGVLRQSNLTDNGSDLPFTIHRLTENGAQTLLFNTKNDDVVITFPEWALNRIKTRLSDFPIYKIGINCMPQQSNDMNIKWNSLQEDQVTITALFVTKNSEGVYIGFHRVECVAPIDYRISWCISQLNNSLFKDFKFKVFVKLYTKLEDGTINSITTFSENEHEDIKTMIKNCNPHTDPNTSVFRIEFLHYYENQE